MRITYLLTAAVIFLGSCQSATPPQAEAAQQKEQAEEPVKETGQNENFAVQLGSDIMGRGLKGAYMIYSDSAAQHFGHNTPTIKSVVPKEFATIISSIKPEKCIGKRVEYTAWIKTKDIKGWAGLWLRIDPADPYNGKNLGFDNMQRRPITGTQDWTVYHVVLDVPEGAASLVYGVLLDGDGQIWVDSMNIKIVDKNIPTTDKLAVKTL